MFESRDNSYTNAAYALMNSYAAVWTELSEDEKKVLPIDLILCRFRKCFVSFTQEQNFSRRVVLFRRELFQKSCLPVTYRWIRKRTFQTSTTCCSEFRVLVFFRFFSLKANRSLFRYPLNEYSNDVGRWIRTPVFSLECQRLTRQNRIRSRPVSGMSFRFAKKSLELYFKLTEKDRRAWHRPFTDKSRSYLDSRYVNRTNSFFRVTEISAISPPNRVSGRARRTFRCLYTEKKKSGIYRNITSARTPIKFCLFYKI